MRLLFLIPVLLYCFQSLNLAQEIHLTKGYDNGYAWTSLSQPIKKLVDYKQNYLSSILDNQKLRRLSRGKSPALFNCDEDIVNLSKSPLSARIDLDAVIRKLDKFYLDDENLIIPVLGAYCYCIKELAGTDKTELEIYRQKLIDYSKH